jgi:TrmH family RNA methyltransferase
MPLSKQQLRDLRRLRQKKYREQEQTCLIEGIRLCEEALRSGADLVRAFFCPEEMANARGRSLLQALAKSSIPLVTIDARTLAELTETQTPQGIAALVRIKPAKPFEPALCREPLVLALDGLADPGNLGTILRTAEWFGVRSVLLSCDTVELYNPKVVRSSMGSLFRLQVHEGVDLARIAGAAKAAGWRLLTAEVAEGVSSRNLAASGRDLLFIGSEAHGLVTQLDHQIDLRMTIPGMGGVESLNAAIAAGILLYQLTAPKQE